MVTADQLVAHAVGDYLLQSHWMASEKTKRHLPALAHALSYGLPFLLLTRSPLALAVIVLTHFCIDRWRLAKYICWAKNQVAPAAYRPPRTATGYDPNVPDWLGVWLLIISDNLLHIAINAIVLRYL